MGIRWEWPWESPGKMGIGLGFPRARTRPSAQPCRDTEDKAHLDFLDWARSYDEGDLSIRSRALHEAWLTTLPCPVIRLEGDLSTDEHLARIIRGSDK